jgi:hypothetical protein
VHDGAQSAFSFVRTTSLLARAAFSEVIPGEIGAAASFQIGEYRIAAFLGPQSRLDSRDITRLKEKKSI